MNDPASTESTDMSSQGGNVDEIISRIEAALEELKAAVGSAPEQPAETASPVGRRPAGGDFRKALGI